MADPTLYLYTSLTAGSSHIITATSRMETILKANKLPFRAIDCATDEKARQLWSRRSRGRKIPGLVKYGQIIADLEQVEEWNEFGELVEQVEDASDVFGDTPMTDTPLPPPVNTLPPNPLKPIVETPAGISPHMSRSSSETRHISISEPTEKKEKAETGDSSTPKGVVGQTPLAMALRQAGVEAAAKAGQKKAAAASAAASVVTKSEATTAEETNPAEVSDTETKSAETSNPTIVATPLSKKTDPSQTTPTPAQTKASPDASLESTSEEEKQSITAAKTPAQLESQGVRKASVDKSSPLSEAASAADTSDVPPTTADPLSETKSTEEQVLDRRRTSSIAKTKSSLSKETSIDEISSDDEEEDENEAEDDDEDESSIKPAAVPASTNVETEKATKPATVKPVITDTIPEHEEVSSTSVSSKPVESTDDITSGAPVVPRMHRGSSLSEAPDDEIREIERKNAIIEESEEDEDESNDDEDDADEDEDEEDIPAQSKPGTTKPVATTGNTAATQDGSVTDNVKKIAATDEEEEKVVKKPAPQQTEAAKPDDASKSVGD